jgi:hypothetical protein
MNTIAAVGLEAWHRVVRNMTNEALDEILSKEVVFHSPVVHTAQEGRALTKLYLMAAFNVLPGEPSGSVVSELGDEGAKPEGSFDYVREIVGERDVVLEFRTEIDGITVNGIDMIHFDADGKIDDFKVMIRPLKAIQKVHSQMATMLEMLKKGE